MGFSLALREWLPPALVRRLKYLGARRPGRKPVYNPTVYYRLEDAPQQRDVWNTQSWMRHAETSLRENVTRLPVADHEIDMVTASLLRIDLSALPRTVSIVDIGGGAGLHYYIAQNALTKIQAKCKFTVIDGPLNCSMGASHFAGNSDVQFFNFADGGLDHAFASCGSSPVVNISSTLHYIADWQSALKSIADRAPSIVCITRHPSADAATKDAFAIQNIITGFGNCGSALVRLIPGATLVNAMKSLGYSCLSDKGISGSANFYWSKGCSDPSYRETTLRSYIFVRDF